jgi:peptide chain release factor
MLIHISSGNGVDEVCRAIWHFFAWLKKQEYIFEVVKLEYAKCDDGYKSIILESEDENLLSLQGTHLWKSQSPFRPKHKRKNWYFTLHCVMQETQVSIDESKVLYQTMKSPKKGGQHVNTTCSGVRAVYAPLSVEAVSYDERSQYRNKSIALKRLKEKINMIAVEKESKAKNNRWRNGKILERGNAVMIFEGDEFREVGI